MQRSQDQRINLNELKGHIVKNIGVERSRRYFYYLSRFLNQKLIKSEFDKSCVRLLGRENLALHNQLIRSILRNASVAKSPPPVQEANHVVKPLVHTVQGSTGRGDGLEQTGSLIPNHHQSDPVWPNGVLSISPRKVRSGLRDRKIRDRPSPLGSNGKVENMLHQPICREVNRGNNCVENGDMGQFDCQRSGKYADERDGVFLRPAKKPRLSNKDPVASVNRDDEDQDEQFRLNLLKRPLTAPLGIPFCSASVGGSRRKVPVSTSENLVSCYESGGLLGAEMLRKRMENIAVAHGLEGVSTECANVLDTMLDVHLKRLIKSCIDLVGARSRNGEGAGKQTLEKQQTLNNIQNGVRPSNSLHIQTYNGPTDITQDQNSISLLDFRVAMELDSHQLGEDWPILRERISLRSFEERESRV